MGSKGNGKKTHIKPNVVFVYLIHFFRAIQWYIQITDGAYMCSGGGGHPANWVTGVILNG